MHRILAAYYFVTCDSEDNGTWKGRSGSAFRGLIFHLFYGNCFQELADYLCCLQFLETAFSVEASDLLLEYYSLLFEERRTGSSEALRKIDFPLLSSFYDFVARNLHIFQIYPDLVMQQALNEPSDSLVKLNLQKKDLYKSPVVECLSVYDNDPRIATLRGFFKNITSASCQKVSSRAFLGSEDGYLKVLDFPSKKIVRSVKSHSSAITFICSAGKDRICTASTDTTLSIWSTVDYSRISVLKGHKHIVSCCCADASSTILLSSGWDNSVRLWSLRDGSSISVIDFRCPVNCIDHHPTKQQVACGLWSGNVEIWDTVSLEKQLTLSSSCSSVKSIVYTLDGLNLITSYMNSDVTIWSSEQGLKMSCLKGHVLPVKSISYSPEGDKIISGSDDCTLKVWPAESGLSVRTFSECKFFPISVLEIITPNHLAVGYQNSDIWVMDMDTGFVTTKMSLEADLVSCFSRFDPLTYASKNTEENWVDLSVVFGTKSGKIMVGNLRTSEITTVGTINARITAIIHNVRVIVCGSSEGDIGLFSYPEMNSKIVTGAHGGSVTALNLFARDENVWVITAGSDKVIKLWEIDYEELVMKEEFFSKHYDYVTCCSSYPDCVNLETYLTGSHDNNIISQNKFSDKTVYEGLKTSVVNIASTDKYVLGCGSDGSVAMWSEEGTLLSYISGVEQSSVVLSFRVDKDISGEFDITLAFVDRDGSVKIRKPNQRSFSYSLEGHNRGITSCCTSQNGEILSCSLDGTVNLWKIPEQMEDSHPEHLASITDICLSVTQNEVISSDAYGNVVIWKLTLSADVPLMYAGKKTYTGGFVKALSLLQDKKLVCAVTQAADGGDKHFIDVLYFDCSASDNNSIYNFQVKNSHYLDSEVLCLDASLKTETVVVGLKSGNFVIITSDIKKTFNISDDWVLGVKLSSHSVDSAEFIFTSLLNGTVKRIETEEALKNVNTIRASMEEIQCPDLGNIPVFISAFCCASFDIVYCGDSQGWLRRYSSAPISKKIHGDSITGIAVCGRYVFTCSLDKTLKGWNSALNQVCLFHSSVPITSLVGCEMVLTSSVSTYILVIGTSSGAIQLLKFHDKQST
ncbi:Telomerase protein component 1 [Araneus ventricosus]|uniref:Telomerase protein component 1 n=1 Tax=Araneus ventricosus TaxID=182803 RepID=A0A4Y2AID8_ARAVE|nr:Telomerase protein component 1 [Araneus ventricosus]